MRARRDLGGESVDGSKQQVNPLRAYCGIGQTTFEMEPFGLIVGNLSQSPSSQCWHSGGKIAQSASVRQLPTGRVVVVVVGQATPAGCAWQSSSSNHPRQLAL